MAIIPQDELDDVPAEAGTGGFLEMNATTKASILLDTAVQSARNSLCTLDGLVGQRPGMAYVTSLAVDATAATNAFQGGYYYAVPGCEALLAARKGVLSAVRSLLPLPTVDAVGTMAATGRVQMTQLVTHAYIADSGIGVRWAKYASGWSAGQVTAFSDDSAMPVFGALCAHGYRLLAAAKDSDEVFPSALLQAAAKADWSRSSAVRVGNGTADPIQRMISGQDRNLLVLKRKSVWKGDTSDAASANWSFAQLSDKAGCIAAGSAAQVGQDTFFLSEAGVVSLSALLVTDALSQASVISQPIEYHLRRLNSAALEQVHAIAWRQYYLLAVPLGNDTAPRDVFAYDVTARKWVGHWYIQMPDVAEGTNFAGLGALIDSSFGGHSRLVMADNCGRVWWLDPAISVDEVVRVDGAATTQEIVQDVTTKAWDFGVPENKKSLLNMTVEFWESSSGTAQLAIVRDGKDSEVVAAVVRATANPGFPIGFPCAFVDDKGLKRAFSLRHFGRAYEVALRVTETTGEVKLRSVRMTAFVDPAEVEQ